MCSSFTCSLCCSRDDARMWPGGVARGTSQVRGGHGGLLSLLRSRPTLYSKFLTTLWGSDLLQAAPLGNKVIHACNILRGLIEI